MPSPVQTSRELKVAGAIGPCVSLNTKGPCVSDNVSNYTCIFQMNCVQFASKVTHEYTFVTMFSNLFLGNGCRRNMSVEDL